MSLEYINTLLQEVAEMLKLEDIKTQVEKLEDEELCEWLNYMENIHSAYSYCEE